MNQLQSLLQDSLIATGNVENCAIIRRKDISLRASSPGFSLSTPEMEELVEAFKHPTQTRDDGIVLDGVLLNVFALINFQSMARRLVQGHNNVIIIPAGRQKLGLYKGECGLVLVRTATLLLVGTYTGEMYPSICVEAVEKLADYFREKGR